MCSIDESDCGDADSEGYSTADEQGRVISRHRQKRFRQIHSFTEKGRKIKRELEYKTRHLKEISGLSRSGPLRGSEDR